jgi:hypothetical protein
VENLPSPDGDTMCHCKKRTASEAPAFHPPEETGPVPGTVSRSERSLEWPGVGARHPVPLRNEMNAARLAPQSLWRSR